MSEQNTDLQPDPIKKLFSSPAAIARLSAFCLALAALIFSAVSVHPDLADENVHLYNYLTGGYQFGFFDGEGALSWALPRAALGYPIAILIAIGLSTVVKTEAYSKLLDFAALALGAAVILRAIFILILVNFVDVPGWSDVNYTGRAISFSVGMYAFILSNVLLVYILLGTRIKQHVEPYVAQLNEKAPAVAALLKPDVETPEVSAPADNSSGTTPSQPPAKAGLTSGVVSCVCALIGFFVPFLGLLLALVGLVAGIRAYGAGKATDYTPAQVLGIIGALVSGLSLVAGIGAILALFGIFAAMLGS